MTRRAVERASGFESRSLNSMYALEGIPQKISYLSSYSHIQITKFHISWSDNQYWLVTVGAVKYDAPGSGNSPLQELVKFRRLEDWTRLAFILRDMLSADGWKESKPYKPWGAQ